MDNPSNGFLTHFAPIWRWLTGDSHQPATECDHVRNFIEFIEDRRALYTPYFLEYPTHVIESVQQISTEASAALSLIAPASSACAPIGNVYAACSVFLGRAEIAYARRSGATVPGHILLSAVVTLREALALEAATLAGNFALDLPPELALISSKHIRAK